MNLEHVLRQIHPDCANLTHGRLPQVVLNTSTLAHQGRWGASTTPSVPFPAQGVPAALLDRLIDARDGQIGDEAPKGQYDGNRPVHDREQPENITSEQVLS
jgi:hypothetical protein